MYCEDYPCCGHTPADPCERQPYDEPGYFDVTQNPHALCEHEAGFCDVWEDDEEEDFDADEDWDLDGPAHVREDEWLDGSYEE